MNSEEEYNKKRNKDAEKRLLRNLVKKYVDHVSVLRKYSSNVNPNIENEFVRNYIAFLMITKGAGEGYHLFNEKDKSIHEDIALYNLSLATALINQDFAGLLTQYITEKRYQHERGFFKGLCSILTGIYLTDVYLQKMIEDRFRAYDLRKKDMLWISNRLLLLSLLYRFSNESWDSLMCFVEEDFIILKNYSNKVLKDISFPNISEMVKKAMDVNHFILNMYQTKDLKTPKSKPERGNLVVSKEGKLFIVKNIEGSNMVLHGGIDLQGRPYEWAITMESDKIKNLGMIDALKSYYNGLLLSKNSSWYLKA